MKLQKTKVMFFLLALVSTLIFRQSKADVMTCWIPEIDKSPGCADALRKATQAYFRSLSRDCCRIVGSLAPGCFLPLYPDKSYSVKIFDGICSALKFPPPMLRH